MDAHNTRTHRTRIGDLPVQVAGFSILLTRREEREGTPRGHDMRHAKPRRGKREGGARYWERRIPYPLFVTRPRANRYSTAAANRCQRKCVPTGNDAQTALSMDLRE